MRRLASGAFVAGSLAISLDPVAAAGFGQAGFVQTTGGGFAGARLRIPLGAAASHRAARISLTVAPTLRLESASGARTLFGEGVALDFGPRRTSVLAIAGTPVSHLFGATRLGVEGETKEGSRKGVSTALLVAGGVLLTGALVYGLLIAEARSNENKD